MRRVKQLLGRGSSTGDVKGDAEMDYWRQMYESENGRLWNGHFEEFFTTYFSLDRSFYDGKRVVDIGCGPRGSLEWATNAGDRVGVDPLVPSYRDLGIEKHAMRYIAAGAESIPVADGSFDIVTTMNSFDHVDDVDATIAELTRIAAPGATLLLLTEVGHEPTPTEPQTLDWDVVDKFTGWRVAWQKRNGLRDDHAVYKSISEDRPYTADPGLLRVRFARV